MTHNLIVKLENRPHAINRLVQILSPGFWLTRANASILHLLRRSIGFQLVGFT